MNITLESGYILSTRKGSITKEVLGDMLVYHIRVEGCNPQKRYTRKEALRCYYNLAKGIFAE